ncbi:MAG TPA: TetR/AcrR family transcriptional regulator [Adhaeribacter sp.]|nr:TetR/AcrR family transcriptional regulator [Adhaeribacter sp.]
MRSLLANIKIQVEEKVYLRDPDATETGRKIVSNAILLIDELGLEAFTFKKLAERIESTEATVYRYFESKHKLLVYLISWYWNWLEYKLVFATNNIASPQDRLKIAIQILAGSIENDDNFGHIDEVTLQRIVISESAKAYLTKDVDEDNREGYFRSYKRLCHRIVEIVSEINPAYKYPDSLVSTIAESAHYQKFFSLHLPSLTNVGKKEDGSLVAFLTQLDFCTLGVSKE